MLSSKVRRDIADSKSYPAAGLSNDLLSPRLSGLTEDWTAGQVQMDPHKFTLDMLSFFTCPCLDKVRWASVPRLPSASSIKVSVGDAADITVRDARFLTKRYLEGIGRGKHPKEAERAGDSLAAANVTLCQA